MNDLFFFLPFNLLHPQRLFGSSKNLKIVSYFCFQNEQPGAEEAFKILGHAFDLIGSVVSSIILILSCLNTSPPPPPPLQALCFQQSVHIVIPQVQNYVESGFMKVKMYFYMSNIKSLKMCKISHLM